MTPTRFISPRMRTRSITHPAVRKAATAIALSSLLLSGCASIAPSDSNVATVQTSSPRIYSDALDLDGRLSVLYQKNERNEALHGSFTWNQTGERSKIAILSPLGQILATIDVGADGATLIESGQAPRTASDVDALAAQALGWPLPVSGLRNWLQGFATDANNKPFIAAPGNADVTTRDGWHIQYLSWQDEHQTPAQNRPKRIDLERQTEQAGKVEIRIVIDNWQAH
jgi:outer membrane lipoprotein LolB